MLSVFYKYRFEIFFCSQITILFESLIVPITALENILSPILFQINLLAGVLLISKKKRLMWFFVVMLVIVSVFFGFSLQESMSEKLFNFLRVIIYFLFYVVVCIETVKQIWKAKQVNESVIFGLISGYVSLGLIGFFIFLSIEMVYPGSFQGLTEADVDHTLTDRLLYFSYITMMTIGYGDVLPITILAQMTSILIGLMGQFYLVIITATIVGKYISQSIEVKNNL